jgi:uncharacterized protein YggE
MKRLIFFALCFTISPLFGQTSNTGDFIAVVGEARGSFVPDMVTFDFEINVTDKKQLTAVQKLNEQVTRLIDKLAGLGLDTKQIKLSGYSMGESMDYSGDKPKSTGYEAQEDFELEIRYSDDDFNMIIDSISGTKFPDLTFTYYMSFSDSLKNKLKNDLIARASDDATQIAETLAKSRKVTLGTIFSIEYTGNISELYGQKIMPPPPPPPPVEIRANEKVEPPRISSRVSLKGIEAEQEVRIVFRIK